MGKEQEEEGKKNPHPSCMAGATNDVVVDVVSCETGGQLPRPMRTSPEKKKTGRPRPHSWHARGEQLIRVPSPPAPRWRRRRGSADGRNRRNRRCGGVFRGTVIESRVSPPEVDLLWPLLRAAHHGDELLSLVEPITTTNAIVVASCLTDRFLKLWCKFGTVPMLRHSERTHLRARMTSRLGKREETQVDLNSSSSSTFFRCIHLRSNRFYATVKNRVA
jgi:hypothetical protein